MNLFRRFKNYRFVKKLIKGKIEIKSRYSFDTFCERAFYVKNKLPKGKCERNNLAFVIKKYRKKYPYILQGWGKAKKEYQNYFKKENAIQNNSLVNLKGRYLTRFQYNYPVKGKKDFEYYISSFWNGDKFPIYKIIGWESEYNSYKALDYTDKIIYIDKDEITSYLHSKDNEIKDYKNLRYFVSKCNKERNSLYKEIEILLEIKNDYLNSISKKYKIK